MGEIAAELPISRPAVSRHLRLLKEARLVSEHSEGTRRVYELEGEGVAVVQEYLLGVWGEAAARFGSWPTTRRTADDRAPSPEF